MTDARILERVMLAFEGERVPRWVERRLAAAPAAGVTLFRAFNVREPGQVRELAAAFQRAGATGTEKRAQGDGDSGADGAAGPTGPLLVAADQETGQLMALGDGATGFAGNMALGAVGDEDLAERVGTAIGREARAMGINVTYTPVLDLATEPGNAAMGIRSFGDDPAAVGRLGAAMIRGLQAAGVAATMKHFPGLGAVDQDTHHELAVVRSDRRTLDAGELVPFRAAIAAGAKLAMSAHVAVPALNDDPTLPATLSRTVMTGTLRDELGFAGVSISDALDMRALAQGAAQAVEVIAAIRAGDDLLLTTADATARRRIEATLLAAAARHLFEPADLDASRARLADLRRWLGGTTPQPDLDVIGSAAHVALSRELAERALTRTDRAPDGAEPAPISVPPSARILAIMPEPADLTPADTSSLVAPGLGRALRTRFSSVEEVVVPGSPRRRRHRRPPDARDVVRCRRHRDHRSPPSAGPGGPRPGHRGERGPGHRGRAADSLGRRRLPAGRARHLHLLDPARPARGAGAGARRRDRVPGAAARGGRHPDPMTLRDEIHEQPDVAARLLADQADAVEAIAASLRDRPVRHVVIAARGTSDHAAIYAQYVLGVRHRLSVGLGTPSIVSLYGAAPDVADALVIGISQSGASPDIVAVIAEARVQGAPTIAITNEPGSALAAAADRTIALGAGTERAIAATKTYTAELLAIAMLSAALADDPADRAALAAVPEALALALELEPDIARIAADQASATRALVIARGYEYATAREWALKLKELARVFADPYSSADFQHGPLALVEPGVPVLAVARAGAPAADLVALLARLRADLGAEILVASDQPAALELATWPVALPAGTPEWLGPIVSIVAGQLHAYHLTRARGLDPDAPRNLSKVTRTT